MLTLFTLPDASSTFSSIGDYSGQSFTEFLPLVYLGAGILIGGMIVGWLLGVVVRSAKKVMSRGGGRKRRR